MSKLCSTQEAYQLLHNGALLHAEIEHSGVRVDKDYLDRTLLKIDREIEDCHKEMKADKEVYPRLRRAKFADRMKRGIPSRQQLGTVLKGMGYHFELTETELDKVDKTALEKIPLKFVQNFQSVERLKKVKSTYLLGIKREMVAHLKGDYYIHPSYNLNTVATFRSSCDNPNFQNVPVRNPEMSEMVRRCYIPPAGWHFVEIDFAQLEVRIAYCYHEDPKMGKYLKENYDFHNDWAARAYLLNEDQVSKNARYAAKNMLVFPEFYGSGYYQCAQHLWEATEQLPGMAVRREGDEKGKPTGRGLRKHLASKGITKLGRCDPREDPEPGTYEYHLYKLERQLWEQEFPVYASWKKEWFQKYQKAGGFMMKTGFAVNGFHKRNDVINYPVQGAAFHCLLKCLIKIQAWLKKHKMKTRLVGQIHDSLQAVSPPDELQDFLSYCKWVMTVWLPRQWDWIICPLEVEMEVAPESESWYKKAEWTLQAKGWAKK